MIDSSKSVIPGTARMDGQRVTFTFHNCVYEGTMSGMAIAGKARYTVGPRAGTAWNYRVEYHTPVQGKVFAGQENLRGFGAVSFRFVDATTVDMQDKNGVTQGSYMINGNDVVLTFGPTDYRGQLQGQSLSGSARNTARNLDWTFRVNEQK